MMPLTTIILLVLALYMLQIFLQETSRFGFDLWGIVGNRDKLPELSVVAGRLDRAKNNMSESLPIFLTLALLALIKGGDTSAVAHAALLFLIARVVYVPAYVSGITMLRSFVWLVAVVSLVMMALPLI
ncbi:MAG: MAPEG family protein [Burkholderiales bacterium]|nr:MAPEG family protein [Burkholderiales bacterium]